MSREECCGRCRYNKYSPDGEGVRNEKFYCGHENSLEYGVPTFYDDVCDDFEPKDGSEKPESVTQK